MSGNGFTIRSNNKTRKSLIKIGHLSKDVKAALHSGFQELGANLVKTGENQALNEPKHGREYLRKGGVVHIASKAGQSPALDDGDYFDSFNYVFNSPHELEFGNQAEYAGYLEDGTETMEPRPGVLNAVKASAAKVRNYLDSGIKKALDLES